MWLNQAVPAGGLGRRLQLGGPEERPEPDGRPGERVRAPLLAVDDVHAAYQPGVDILQGMSLAVSTGGFVLVIGPNGAGKSTLLKTVFGLLSARGGISLAGRPIANLPSHEIKRLGIYWERFLQTFPHTFWRSDPHGTFMH